MIGKSGNLGRWVPLNKGGEFRKWYGNNEFVIDWGENGVSIKNYAGAVIRNESYYFKESITWNDITSYKVSFRFKEAGEIFNDAGPSIFASHDTLMDLIAFGNTKIMQEICYFIAPTIHYTVGQISNAPIATVSNMETRKAIEKLAEDCISISRSDWDSFETSWDFKRHPLV